MSDEHALATVPNQQPSVAGMLQAVIHQGVTKENVTALEQLVGLYERLEARNAEKAFNEAFNALQDQLPQIVATSDIPNRGKYERFEDVMRVVKPLLVENGFAVSFKQAADDKRITVTCRLKHIAGHSEDTPFAVRLGGRADSDTQADCKASTTAKRNALLQALNIVIRQDVYQNEDDPRNDAGFITQQQADELRELCDETSSDRKKFLEFAGADDFEKIYSSRLDDLMDKLNRKRGAR